MGNLHAYGGGGVTVASYSYLYCQSHAVPFSTFEKLAVLALTYSLGIGHSMAVYGSGNAHQLPVSGSVKLNATPCTLNENIRRQQLADSLQQQAQQQPRDWTGPQQQQQDLQQQHCQQPRQQRDDSQPNTWQTAIEPCLHSHPGASQLTEHQEVGYSVSDSDSEPNSARRGAWHCTVRRFLQR